MDYISGVRFVNLQNRLYIMFQNGVELTGIWCEYMLIDLNIMAQALIGKKITNIPSDVTRMEDSVTYFQRFYNSIALCKAWDLIDVDGVYGTQTLQAEMHLFEQYENCI